MNTYTLMRLVDPVDNPHVDRRTDTWTLRPQFEPGLYIVCSCVVTVLEHSMTQVKIRKYGNATDLSKKETVELLQAELVEVTDEPVKSFLATRRHGYLDYLDDDLMNMVAVLIETGKLDPSDLTLAAAVIDARWDAAEAAREAEGAQGS